MYKALIGGSGKAFKAIKRKRNQPRVVKMEDYVTDVNMLNDLKDPANQVPLASGSQNLNSNSSSGIFANASSKNFGPKGGDSRFDLGSKNDSFIGKNQLNTFSTLTSPESVDRGGKTISSSSLDPVGIKTAMNPPLAVPIQGNQSEELESLYS